MATISDKSKVLDEESRKAMIKELAIINGLTPDEDNNVNDLNAYFKKLGIE